MNGRSLFQIKIDDAVTDRLRQLGADMGKIATFSGGDVANDMADYIRQSFLNGRAVAKRTGELHESVRAWLGRDAWFVRYGVGVKGWLNYVEGWRGSSQEFLRPGAKEYIATGKYIGLVDENLDRMVKKMELM
jgi:hypothetical protein